MKNILLLIVSTTLVSIDCFAQQPVKGDRDEKGTRPTSEAAAAFKKEFPGSSATRWTREEGNYEVEFLLKGEKMSVEYNPRGVFQQQEKSIPVNQLPAGAIQYIREHFKGAAISEAEKITTAKGTVSYEAETKRGVLLFDANGKFTGMEKE